MATFTSEPPIQPLVTWTEASPGAIPSGTRKLTLVAIHGAGITGSGKNVAGFSVHEYFNWRISELASCGGLAAKGCPGSAPGRVGPRPEAKSLKISPDFAGLAALKKG